MNNPYQTAQHNNTVPGPPDKKKASCFKQLEITASYSYRFFQSLQQLHFQHYKPREHRHRQAKTLDACNSNEARNPEQVP